eukprot:g8648.t2
MPLCSLQMNAARVSLRSVPSLSTRSLNTSRLLCRAQSQELNQRIAQFYDSSSRLWEDVWGEHMHHGIYRPESPPVSHRAAQLDLIEEVLEWAEVDKATKLLDVGCGIGGSARHLARKYNCDAKGITLSPAQVQRARELTTAANLDDRVSFEVCDALNLPFQDNSFDLIWSLESGEHMPDKKEFVSEMVRVCKPGGSIILVTWCHRSLKPPNSPELSFQEKTLFDLINSAYALPSWVSLDTYENLFNEMQVQNVKTEDWSKLVEPFWGAVIRSALTVDGVFGLLRAGPTTIGVGC